MIFLLALLVIAFCVAHMSKPDATAKDFIFLLIAVLVIVMVFLIHSGAVVN
jgi:hypothetical protein